MWVFENNNKKGFKFIYHIHVDFHFLFLFVNDKRIQDFSRAKKQI